MLRRARIHSTRGFPALQERADEGHTWTHRPILNRAHPYPGSQSETKAVEGHRDKNEHTRSLEKDGRLRGEIIVSVDNRLSRRVRDAPDS